MNELYVSLKKIDRDRFPSDDVVSHSPELNYSKDEQSTTKKEVDFASSIKKKLFEMPQAPPEDLQEGTQNEDLKSKLKIESRRNNMRARKATLKQALDLFKQFY